MDNSGFEMARWDHWLLVISFVAIAFLGLRLSWQWRKDQQAKQRRPSRAIAPSQMGQIRLWRSRSDGAEQYAHGVSDRDIERFRSRLSQNRLGQKKLSNSRSRAVRSGRYDRNRKRSFLTRIK